MEALGNPMDMDCEIQIVCGPSGAGKTTWVRNEMQRGDLVMDMDYPA